MNTYEAYDAIDAVRWSHLKAMRISPLHYRHLLQAPRRDAPHFRVGQAMHALILEPETFKSRYLRCDLDRRTKAYKDFVRDNPGLTILNADEYDRAVGAASAVLAHPVASEYLLAGLREANFLWTDPDTGLLCKARVDHCGEFLVDLKSTSNLEPHLFASAAVRYGYVGQLAFYLDGLRANGVKVHDEPLLIAVESSPPFDVVPYRFRDDVVDYGRDEYKTLLVKLRHCQQTDTWPGRAADLVDFALPAWTATGDDLELVIDGEAVAV